MFRQKYDKQAGGEAQTGNQRIKIMNSSKRQWVETDKDASQMTIISITEY